MTLTDKGLENIDEICRIIFAYINKLKEQGPQRYIFDEKQKVMKSEFET
jgi:insulysin